MDALEVLVDDFRQVYCNFMQVRNERESGKTVLPVFEIMNWAYAIDDFMKETEGWCWYEAYTGGAMIPGVRYARNTAKHYRGGMLRLAEGAAFPIRARGHDLGPPFQHHVA